jgi:hypothetical protein
MAQQLDRGKGHLMESVCIDDYLMNLHRDGILDFSKFIVIRT